MKLALQPGGKEAKNHSMSLPRSAFLLIPLLLNQCGTSKTEPEERRSAIVPSLAATRAPSRDLMDVRQLIPDISVDLRYATKDNIAKRPLYPQDMPCLLKTATALKLAKAQEILKSKGYSLRLWDAWRPPEVQLLLVEKDRHDLFLDPKSAWSRHCAGVAVDVTLTDLKGREQKLPTYHDEAGTHTRYDYKGGSPTVRRNLQTLQRAMVDAGFYILDTEWWHFDDSDYYYQSAPVVFAHELGITISDDP
jgi:D-alanyl-D-alanine dipeptidase